MRWNIGQIQIVPQPIAEKALDAIIEVAKMPEYKSKDAVLRMLCETLQRLYSPPLVMKEPEK